MNTLPSLYKKQISMHEWFEQIGHKDAEAVRDEDYTRQARLKQINSILGTPYDKPEKFSPRDILDKTQKFLDFFNNDKEKKCRMRLVPKTDDVQKLRIIGITKDEALEWFYKQNIDPDKYEVHFMNFSDNTIWSTTFVINKHGIFGEIIKGGLHQLSQGFHDNKPITFSFDFENWKLSEENNEALEHLQHVIKHLYVDDESKKQKLKDELKVNCVNNYLEGYFETVLDDGAGFYFADYNRVLGRLYEDMDLLVVNNQDKNILTGQNVSPGIAIGKVRIITPEQISQTNLNPDEILVCDMTSPDYVPLMKQAAAIITDRGGILSHAAIVSREMGKPCIVGTGRATETLSEGQQIRVDAGRGMVELI